MSTSDLVGAIIFFVLAAILMILSIRHFGEKGLLLNDTIQLLEIPLFCAAVIYAIVSSVKIYRKEGK